MYDFKHLVKKLEYVERVCNDHNSNENRKLIAHEIMRKVGQELIELGEVGFSSTLKAMAEKVVREIMLSH